MDQQRNIHQIEGNVEKGPVDGEEIRCGRGEIETLLVASLKDSEAPHPRHDALKRGLGRYREKNGGKRGKQKAAENGSERTEPLHKSSGENRQALIEAEPHADPQI